MIAKVKVELSEVRKNDSDVGSLPVQIVLLQQRIDEIKEHLLLNRGDIKAKMAFFKILRRRKKLLAVLLIDSPELYKKLQ